MSFIASKSHANNYSRTILNDYEYKFDGTLSVAAIGGDVVVTASAINHKTNRQTEHSVSFGMNVEDARLLIAKIESAIAAVWRLEKRNKEIKEKFDGGNK